MDLLCVSPEKRTLNCRDEQVQEAVLPGQLVTFNPLYMIRAY